jgi:hypothetical protein
MACQDQLDRMGILLEVVHANNMRIIQALMFEDLLSQTKESFAVQLDISRPNYCSGLSQLESYGCFRAFPSIDSVKYLELEMTSSNSQMRQFPLSALEEQN